MAFHNIEELVEKYNNAETTLQEEAQLRAYFSGDNVAPHLEHYKPLFVFFAKAQNEVYTKDVPLQPKKKVALYKWISVAAAIIVMLGVMVPQVSGPTQQEKDEALLAYNQTMEALSLISIGMNESKAQLNTLALVSEAMDTGREGASRLNEFNKAKNRILKNK